MVLVFKKGASRQEMKDIKAKLEKLPQSKLMEAKKYCGTIRLKEDPSCA